MKYQAYAEYKDSGVEWLDNIPTQWSIASLKMLVDVRDGTHDTPPYVDISDNSYPLVTSKDVTSGVLSFELCKHISEDDYSSIIKRSKVDIGDILMPMIGTVGSPIVVHERDDFAIKNLALFKTFNNDIISTSFLNYFLQSNECEIQFSLEARGGVQNFVSLGTLRDLGVPVISTEEQVNITNFLDHETAKIDTLIEKQQQLIKLLKEKRQAVISHAVTKGLNLNAPMRDSGVEWLGEVPEHWEISRIKNLANMISKGTTPSTIGGGFVDKGVRFLKGENIGKSILANKLPEFFITEEVDEQISRSRLEEGDVLVIIAGATTGMASILQKDLLPANTNQAVSFIRPKKAIYSKLIVRWLSTEFTQRIIWMGAVQAAQPNLSMEDLGNISIAVPPANELIEIIEEVDSCLVEFDELNFKAESAIAIIQERRTALISAAVTGKIDVRNWQASNQNNKATST